MVYITKSFQGVLNFGAKKEIFDYARELRKNETEAEKLLWSKLRSRRCVGLKFRRQHPVKAFILDFYCHEYLLGIEVDGSVHENDLAKEYDLNRTAELESLGITVLRFRNDEVLGNLTKVITEIQHKIEQLMSVKTPKKWNNAIFFILLTNYFIDNACQQNSLVYDPLLEERAG